MYKLQSKATLFQSVIILLLLLLLLLLIIIIIIMRSLHVVHKIDGILKRGYISLSVHLLYCLRFL